jgi:hypothetical protein
MSEKSYKTMQLQPSLSLSLPPCFISFKESHLPFATFTLLQFFYPKSLVGLTSLAEQLMSVS